MIPESPRWLLAMGKEKQARKVLAAGARQNGRQLDGEFEKALGAQPAKTAEDNKGNVFDLFRTANLRKKTLAVFFNWTVCGLCFYGLAQYMGEIGGNIFVNVASSGLIELPGAFLCIYLMEKFGRRNTLLSANLVTAMACILITFLPQSKSPRLHGGNFFWGGFRGLLGVAWRTQVLNQHPRIRLVELKKKKK